MEGTRDGVWWVRSLNCKFKQGGLGEWDSKFLLAEAAVGCESFGKRRSRKVVGCSEGGSDR